jgi:hypothetical protein
MRFKVRGFHGMKEGAHKTTRKLSTTISFLYWLKIYIGQRLVGDISNSKLLFIDHI